MRLLSFTRAIGRTLNHTTAQPNASLVFQYTETGLQYYIAGRHAYFHKLHRVTGNLCHHGVELLLKAKLLEQYTETELADSRRFGHSLQRLWKAFKTQAQVPALAQFDSPIQRLDRFEDIRSSLPAPQDGVG